MLTPAGRSRRPDRLRRLNAAARTRCSGVESEFAEQVRHVLSDTGSGAQQGSGVDGNPDRPHRVVVRSAGHRLHCQTMKCRSGSKPYRRASRSSATAVSDPGRLGSRRSTSSMSGAGHPVSKSLRRIRSISGWVTRQVTSKPGRLELVAQVPTETPVHKRVVAVVLGFLRRSGSALGHRNHQQERNHWAQRPGAARCKACSVPGTCSSTCGVSTTSTLESGNAMSCKSSLIIALCADSS